MKKRKKLIPAILAFCICVSLAGCGNTDSSISNDVSNEIADENSPADEQANNTSKVEDNENSNISIDANYAYYDDLAAEYEKYNDVDFKNISKNIDFRDTRACIADNKIITSYATGGYGNFDDYYLLIYDIASKESKSIEFEKEDEYYSKPYYYYSNHYIYEISNYGNVRKFDLDGNVVLSGFILPEGDHVQKSENLIQYIDASGNIYMQLNGKAYMVTSDFQQFAEIPAPSYAGEHGIGEPVEEYTFVSGYDNYVCAIYGNYVYGSDNWDGTGDENIVEYYDVFLLNPQTMEWKNCENRIYVRANDSSDYIKGVGKYLLGSTFVYDLEKGEQISKCKSAKRDGASYFKNATYNHCYVGGNCSYVLNNENVQTNRWYKLQFDADYNPEKVYITPEEVAEYLLGESEIQDEATVADFLSKGINVVESLGIDNSENKATHVEILPVNETYYIMSDDYGMFLRTYEKGEEEEETIILYENN